MNLQDAMPYEVMVVSTSLDTPLIAMLSMIGPPFKNAEKMPEVRILFRNEVPKASTNVHAFAEAITAQMVAELQRQDIQFLVPTDNGSGADIVIRHTENAPDCYLLRWRVTDSTKELMSDSVRRAKETGLTITGIDIPPPIAETIPLSAKDTRSPLFGSEHFLRKCAYIITAKLILSERK